MPSVSVIVPHYNDLSGLEKCLAALSAQSLDRSEYEIIVADNNSPIDQKVIKSVIGDRAQLVVVKEKGAGPARNGGVKLASSPILAFTDSDCIPDYNWLEVGLGALDDFDLIGGKISVLVEDPATLTPAEAFERVFAFDNRRYVESENFTVTANLFCSLKNFERVGPFKVGLSEDKEWCNRAVKKGCSLGYVKNAVVGHPARKDWLELKGKWERINRETYGLVNGSLKGKLFWAFRSVVLLLSIFPHSVKILNSDQLPNRISRIAALKMLVVQRSWRFVHYWVLLFNSHKISD